MLADACWHACTDTNSVDDRINVLDWTLVTDQHFSVQNYCIGSLAMVWKIKDEECKPQKHEHTCSG